MDKYYPCLNFSVLQFVSEKIVLLEPDVILELPNIDSINGGCCEVRLWISCGIYIYIYIYILLWIRFDIVQFIKVVTLLHISCLAPFHTTAATRKSTEKIKQILSKCKKEPKTRLILLDIFNSFYFCNQLRLIVKLLHNTMESDLDRCLQLMHSDPKLTKTFLTKFDKLFPLIVSECNKAQEEEEVDDRDSFTGFEVPRGPGREYLKETNRINDSPIRGGPSRNPELSNQSMVTLQPRVTDPLAPSWYLTQI